MIFYPRPLEHDFHNAPSDGADFTCASLDFDGGIDHPLARALPALVVLPLAQVSGLEHSLALLFDETQRVRCGQRLMADRLFDVLILQLLRWLLDHPEQADVPPGLITGLADPRLARTLTALHERPGEPWTLASMAATAGMSRSAFAAHFKQVLGSTPADYLSSWRLTITLSELRSGTPVKRIADALGYANASALSRVFTQRVGISPRDWIARQRTSGSS